MPERSRRLRHRRRAHAGGDRRARGGRHAQRSAPVAHLLQSRHQALSGLPGVLRHGGRDRADRRLLQARRTGSGRAQADSLSAGPGRRRQVLDRRAPEAADGAQADLRAQGLAGQRVSARPVRAGPVRRGARVRLRHPAALPHRHHVALGDQAPAGIRRRHFQVPRGARAALGAAPDRDLQDRTGRREQPGHLHAGRQGRHPQARSIFAERSGRLQLLRRTVPGQPGSARVRRDVQGADQDAASAADRDPGRQLQGHRRIFRDPVQRRHPGALERVGVADVPQQQAQRGVPRPHLHRQGAVLPAGVRRGQDLRQAAAQQFAVAPRRARRARWR